LHFDAEYSKACLYQAEIIAVKSENHAKEKNVPVHFYDVQYTVLEPKTADSTESQ